MITKLVIVRIKRVHPEVLGQFSRFAQGEPLPIAPIAWSLEAGLSHWGWTLAGLKLADLTALRQWADIDFGHATILSLGDPQGPPITVTDALAAVGLRVNPAA